MKMRNKSRIGGIDKKFRRKISPKLKFEVWKL
jgi:hypothetical protein